MFYVHFLYLLTVMIVEINVLSHLCACPKPGYRFQMSDVVVFFFVQWYETKSDHSFWWY